MTLSEILNRANAAIEGVELKANTEFTPIEPGVYEVAVTACDGPVDSRTPNPHNPSEFGKYLNIEFTITEGTFAGRKVWTRNNLLCFPKDTTSQAQDRANKAMAIASRERKILLDSIGRVGIEAAGELVGATCRIKTDNEVGKNGKTYTVVKAYLPNATASVAPAYVAQAPVAPAPVAPKQATPASSARPSTRAKMPWEK